MKKEFLTTLILLFTFSTLLHAAENSTGGLPLGLWVAIGILIALLVLAYLSGRTETNVESTETNKGVELEEKVPTRIQHYKFAHVVVKDMFFEDQEKLLQQILKPEGEIRGLWYNVGEFYAENYEDVEVIDGSNIKVTAKEFENKLFVIVSLPEPKERAEAYFLGLIIPRDDTKKARYITLEYGKEKDQIFSVLCEWTKDSHLNFGEGPEPTLDNFRDVLIGMGDVSVQSWNETKPVYDGEEWMVRLWQWADEYDISPLVLPRNSKDIKDTRELDLSFFNLDIEYLPKEIGNLANLEVFSLQGNNLKELPNEFGKLTNLKLLYIDENKLTQLPNEFCSLVNLRRFFAGGNQLTKLPDCIGNLKKLEVLNIYGNKLTSLPESVAELRNLKELSIFDNPIVEISEDIRSLPRLEHQIII